MAKGPARARPKEQQTAPLKEQPMGRPTQPVQPTHWVQPTAQDNESKKSFLEENSQAARKLKIA